MVGLWAARGCGWVMACAGHGARTPPTLSHMLPAHRRIQQELIEARRTGSAIKEANQRRKKVQVCPCSCQLQISSDGPRPSSFLLPTLPVPTPPPTPPRCTFTRGRCCRRRWPSARLPSQPRRRRWHGGRCPNRCAAGATTAQRRMSRRPAASSSPCCPLVGHPHPAGFQKGAGGEAGRGAGRGAGCREAAGAAVRSVSRLCAYVHGALLPHSQATKSTTRASALTCGALTQRRDGWTPRRPMPGRASKTLA